MTEELLTTSQIADTLGMPIRKIISYTERGYLEASVMGPSGYGSRRLWSLNDLKKIEIIRKCESFGLSSKFLRKLCSLLNEEDLDLKNNLIIDCSGQAFNSHEELKGVFTDMQQSPFLCIVQDTQIKSCSTIL